MNEKCEILTKDYQKLKNKILDDNSIELRVIEIEEKLDSLKSERTFSGNSRRQGSQ